MESKLLSMNIERKHHDNFFKTVFADTNRFSQLLNLAAKHNESLAEFVAAIDLSTLTQIPCVAPREGLSGAADLAFQVNLNKSSQKAELLVGIIAEHKSYRDYDVVDQLLRYYFEVMRVTLPKTPVVAVIIYNGRFKWDPTKISPFSNYPEYFQKTGLPFRLEFIDVGSEINTEDLKNIDPSLMFILVAMRYVFDSTKMEDEFKTAVKILLKSNIAKDKDMLNEIVVYLKESFPKEERTRIMDTLEVYKNKGYVSIAEAEFEEGVQKGLKQGELLKAKEMAKAMLKDSQSIGKIIQYTGLSENEIRTL